MSISSKLTIALTAAIFTAAAMTAHMNAQAPAAPTTGATTTQAAAASANPFPAVNPKNFTASSPTVDEVNGFLKAIWGYDENRQWSVAAILKTPAPGVAKIVVFIAEKGSQAKGQQAVFFTTPDGKHAIADQVIDFGVRPFAANRAVLQAEAHGAAEGATGKDFLMVEFADLQCIHCKEAQTTMDNLHRDFPQARIVYENFPIAELHPFAFRAAAEGVCVRKAKGDDAFYTYVHAVYDKQSGLTQSGVDATLAAAATAAGTAPSAMATCAATPEAAADVQASIALGTQLGVDSTPTLFVNGHALPVGGALPYETLKKIVAFQGRQDGLDIRVQPSLTNLK